MGRQALYGGPFGRLTELAAGDVITVYTGQGTHEYTVTGQRRAGDPEPAELLAGAGRLTLVTADGTAFLPDGVLWVDADLTSTAQTSGSRSLASGALDQSEQAMEGESDALALILWGQTLLLAAVAVAWARATWGHWQAWIVGVPVLCAAGLSLLDQVARWLPNLM